MFPIHFSNSISSRTCLLFSAYVPPVGKIMIPDGLTSCIHWKAESKNLTACLHVRFACGRNRRREFKSKFGVRNGVHLSVHLRSVMRSAESCSREKNLITASVLRAPVAFRKEAKSLFSQGSEGKLITSAATSGRDREVPERTEIHGRRHCERLMHSCRPVPVTLYHHITYSSFSSTVNKSWHCERFFSSVVVVQQNQQQTLHMLCSWWEKTLRCEKNGLQL